jgi:putative mRNA 3-end processing factor
LNEAIAATHAERVLLTHGYSAVMARWLAEKGFQTETLATRFTGDSGGEESTEGTAGSARQESMT